VDTIAEAGAAAMEASNYLNELQKNEDRNLNSEFGMRNAERKNEEREQQTANGIQSVVAG
jgi:hypothetical protein